MDIAMVIATATAMVAVIIKKKFYCGAAAWAMYQPHRKAGN